MASFKINDLRRLTKKDLAGICNRNNITINKENKDEIISLIIDRQVTTVEESVGVAAVTTSLPVPLDSTDINYSQLEDRQLTSIPQFSFAQLYSYSCGADSQSVKALDRAVKHVEAGDIADLAMCQVIN